MSLSMAESVSFTIKSSGSIQVDKAVVISKKYLVSDRLTFMKLVQNFVWVAMMNTLPFN